jgi:malonyl-CoA O-methyltransferase
VDAFKEIIAESFSRSATRYDAAADVQQQAGDELLQAIKLLVPNDFTPQRIVDVGCGTGFFARDIVECFRPSHYVGVDLAQGMLDVAARNNSDVKVANWQCGDAENLPLADQSVDIIYANFSLQWCENLPALMESFHRVLKPGGYCCFTSLGKSTLHELRHAWSQVDSLNHVNQFHDETLWSTAIEQQGFIPLNRYNSTVIAYFESVSLALHSFKNIGANIVAGEQRTSLTGKRRFALFCEAYEHFRDAQGIPVTYDIQGWVLQKSSS